MCFGGGSSAPVAPTVDPEGERRKVAAEAQIAANERLLSDARRKRKQKGLLATDDGISVLASAAPADPAASSVLGSGGR